MLFTDNPIALHFKTFKAILKNIPPDSPLDMPLALCAEKAQLVIDHATKVVDWPDLDKETLEIVKEEIDTGWNIHLKED